MAAIHIKTDGTETPVYPENGTDFNLKEMQGFVGGYVEVITLSNGKIMLLNEEGKVDGLPVNKVATQMTRDVLSAGDMVIGDVLICDDNQIK